MAYYVVTAMLGLMIITGSYASNHDIGQLELPKLFSDHMVIQRDQPIRVWGKATPFERVEVSLKNNVARTAADFRGSWSATLPAMPAGGPYELIVQGTHRIIVKDVLLGDVWLCAGQSNMLRTVADCDFTPAEIQYTDFSKLRHFIRQRPALDSIELPKVWRDADEQNVSDFSAVAYVFSSRVQAKSGVPIGIIECAVGGTPIKTWISKATIGKRGGIPGLNCWTYSRFYDDLIVPLSSTRIKGVIWYQGESDVFGAAEYTKLLRMLIKDLRSAFKDPVMPFIFVQLPNCGKQLNVPGESLWAELREAQQKCATAANVYMTVNIDTAHNGAEGADLHPTTKTEVGRRLAAVALAKCYGIKNECTSPAYESYRREGGAFLIHICNTQSLTGRGGPIKGFALAGEDHKFQWANAEILPNRKDVKVTCETIPHPVAVRYAWADNPDCNLYSSDGLPVAPFRTDNWRSPVLHPKK